LKEAVMRTATIMAVVFLSVLMQASFASSANFTIGVGGTEISIPAPEGFHEISKLSSETRDHFETFTPPDNRLLGVFLLEEDLGLLMKDETPDVRRYMLLQSYRKLEDYDLSRREFDELADSIKEQNNSLMQEVKREVESLLAATSEKLSEEYQTSVAFQVSNSVPLGVFLERRNAIGYANLTKYETAIEDEVENSTMIMSISLLRLKNRLLYAYVYERYETQESIDWVRKTSTQWAKAMLEANQVSGVF